MIHVGDIMSMLGRCSVHQRDTMSTLGDIMIHVGEQTDKAFDLH